MSGNIGYKRMVSVSVKPKEGDSDRLTVVSELRDPDHEFVLHYEMVISERRIMDPVMTLQHQPYPICSEAIDRVRGLHEKRIVHGFSDAAEKAVGGPNGCTHIMELVMQSARTVSTVLFGLTKGGRTWDNINDRIPSEKERLQPHLQGTCIAFPMV